MGWWGRTCIGRGEGEEEEMHLLVVEVAVVVVVYGPGGRGQRGWGESCWSWDEAVCERTSRSLWCHSGWWKRRMMNEGEVVGCRHLLSVVVAGRSFRLWLQSPLAIPPPRPPLEVPYRREKSRHRIRIPPLDQTTVAIFAVVVSPSERGEYSSAEGMR